MVVLSLFDGISCGRVALDRLGIHVDEYYASEIDKAAIKVATHNYPDTVELGDVCGVKGSDFAGRVDLLIGGSPCQGFSRAGQRKNFDDPRSALVMEYVRVLEEVKPRYFMLENVQMPSVWRDKISELLGVEPFYLESALVSAAPRKRFYWTNLPYAGPLQDRGITFGDIRERGVPKDSGFYYSEKMLDWIARHSKKTGNEFKIIEDFDKLPVIVATMSKGCGMSNRFFGIEDVYGLRFVTPLECERCMGLPDGYASSVVCKTEAYHEVGNGWQVDTIMHLFRGLSI